MRDIKYTVSDGIEDAHISQITARRAELALACVRNIGDVVAMRTHIKCAVIWIAAIKHLFNFMNDNRAEMCLSFFQGF